MLMMGAVCVKYSWDMKINLNSGHDSTITLMQGSNNFTKNTNYWLDYSAAWILCKIIARLQKLLTLELYTRASCIGNYNNIQSWLTAQNLVDTITVAPEKYFIIVLSPNSLRSKSNVLLKKDCSLMNDWRIANRR